MGGPGSIRRQCGIAVICLKAGRQRCEYFAVAIRLRTRITMPSGDRKRHIRRGPFAARRKNRDHGEARKVTDSGAEIRHRGAGWAMMAGIYATAAEASISARRARCDDIFATPLGRQDGRGAHGHHRGFARIGYRRCRAQVLATCRIATRKRRAWAPQSGIHRCLPVRLVRGFQPGHWHRQHEMAGSGMPWWWRRRRSPRPNRMAIPGLHVLANSAPPERVRAGEKMTGCQRTTAPFGREGRVGTSSVPESEVRSLHARAWRERKRNCPDRHRFRSPPPLRSRR